MLAGIIFTAVALALSGVGVSGEEGGCSWSILTFMPGDTLLDLARQYEVEEGSLREWNGLGPGEVEPGLRLRLCARTLAEERLMMRYRLPGPTTWKELAQHHQMPLANLLAANRRTRGGQVGKGTMVTVYSPISRWNGLFLDGGVQLAPRDSLVVKSPDGAWGRPVVVRTLEAIADRVAARFPGSRLVAADLSRPRGGRFPPHLSHRGGLDADLGLFITGEDHTFKFRVLKPGEMDAVRTWFLVKELIHSRHAKRILLDWYLQRELYAVAQAEGADEEQLAEWLQYPAPRWKEVGIVRHHKGHRNHLHVRFEEPPPGEVIL